MKRVLSVDWDYFINATAHQRAMLFPDGGNENISYTLQDFIWNSHYSSPRSAELRNIGILKREYNLTHDILRKFVDKYLHSWIANPHREVLVAVSHRWIYDFVIERTRAKEEFEVYNVDFHHDMYHLRSKDQEVNCGNWVNCLLEKRPKMKYHWVKREDSDDEVLGGAKVDCADCKLRDLADLEFDYVFICRSDCWSPPHLDSYFETLWVLMRRYMPIEIENKVSYRRKYAPLNDLEERMQKYPNATCAICGAIIPEGSPSILCCNCNAGQ